MHSEIPGHYPLPVHTSTEVDSGAIATPDLDLPAEARSPWKTLGIFGGVVLLGVGLVTGVRYVAVGEAQTEETVAARVLPVEAIAIEPVNSYEVQRAYTGEIAALRASELSFEQAGLLVSLLVDDGDVVAAGEPLANLDTSRLETQRLELLAQRERAVALLDELQTGPRQEDIATARADLNREAAQLQELQAGPRQEDIETARANVRDLQRQLELAQLKVERRQNLYSDGAIAREDLDELVTEASALQARLDAAQSDLQELLNGTRSEQIDAQAARYDAAQSNLQELLNGTRSEQIAAQQAAVREIDARLADLDVSWRKSTIYAPFAGTVAARRLDEGTYVSPGAAVLRLVERAAPEVRIGVPPTVADRLSVGSQQPVNVGSDRYTATVTSFLPEVNPDTRTRTAILTLDPEALQGVAPGQTARLEIAETVPAEGYWLPTEALVRGVRGLWSCYVLVESDTVADAYQIEQRTVEILHREGDRALVRGTLSPGERIVASGTQRLVPDQLVRPAQ